MKSILLASALLCTLGGAQAAAVNLVTDGSFESVNQPSGGYGVYASLPGWSLTSGPGIEVRNNDHGAAFDGGNYVELDSTGNSAISQTLATIAGAHYALGFAYSARGGLPAATNGIEVFWNNQSLGQIALDGLGQSGNVWKQYGFDVVGTGSDRLGFAAIGASDSVGGSLDAVSVTAAVPEPSTCALLAGGLALLGVTAKKRRTIAG